MIYIKTPEEIEKMREGGEILAQILKKVAENVRPGTSTKYLDKLATKLIYQNNAKPSFKGYEGYPNALCISVNEEVVHGIPSSRILKEGDIIGLDLGIVYKGMYTDHAVTVPAGGVSKKAQKLINVTKEALEQGIKQVKVDGYIGDVSWAIQKFVEENGFSVVRDLIGHGVGKKVQEEPEIPNFGQAGQGAKLEKGMTLAIEPMVNIGDWKVKILSDGWTVVTADGSLSAHFEHTIVVVKNGAEVLTKIDN